MRVKILICLCLLLAMAGTARAEGLLLKDPAACIQGVETTEAYLSLLIPLEAPAPVRLQVEDSSGRCTYQVDYGQRTESFRTEKIYLRLSGLETTCYVTLTVGEESFRIPVTRRLGRLTNQPACSAGYPLDELTGYGSWQCATLLDLNALADGPVEAPLLSAGAYTCGTLRYELQNGALTVSASLPDGEVTGGRICVALDALTARSLGTPDYEGDAFSLDQAYDVSGAAYAAVFADLRVSFTPQADQAYLQPWLPGQDALWQRMQQETISEAIG